MEINIFITAVAVVILAIGLFQTRNSSVKTNNTDNKVVVKMENKPILSATDNKTNTKESMPSASPSPQASNPTPPPLSTNLDSFRYPNANLTSSNNSSLSLSSPDNPDVITNWYKAKLKSLGYNSNSFVTTKANEKVLNKLVSNNGKTEIRVTISKNEGDSTTKIDLTVNSY